MWSKYSYSPFIHVIDLDLTPAQDRIDPTARENKWLCVYLCRFLLPVVTVS